MAEEGVNYANLWADAAMSEPAALTARRAREKAPPARSARRAISGGAEIKSVQLNVKITPTLRGHIQGMAEAERCSIPDLIERAMTAYMGNK
jgi:hypothetical protein